MKRAFPTIHKKVNTGTWLAIKKDTKEVVASGSSYLTLLKKANGSGLMYIKVPPKGRSYIFAN